MDIWSPLYERRSRKGRLSSEVLVSIALGLPAGLLSGAIVTVVVWMLANMLGGHGYLYFLAIPIEIGLCGSIFLRNKAFAVSCAVTAICASVTLATIGTILDGPPFFTY